MSQSRAATMLNMMLTKGKSMMKKYQSTYKKGEMRPHVQKMKKMMDEGYRP